MLIKDVGPLGTYEQSYSWFELSLLRDGKEVPNSRHVLQYNVHGRTRLLEISAFADLPDPPLA